MGFLEIGSPLNWNDTKKVAQYVKQEGLKQLLHTWRLNRYREDHDLKWGDELEYMMVHMDNQNKKARLYIDAPSVLKRLQQKEAEDDWPECLCRSASLVLGHRIPYLHSTEWHPEFANFMIEAVPALPFDLSVNSLLQIEDSMVSRRCKLQCVLPPNVYVLSLPAFPRLGLPDSIIRADGTHGPEAARPNEAIEPSGQSQFFTKEMVNPHPRFETLVNNIVARRKCRTTILLPAYKDLYTHELPAWGQSIPMGNPRDPIFRKCVDERAKITMNPVRDQIYMDHFGFGMGNHCLQMTFGTPSLSEARYLYDQMAVLAPLFLSLSAGTAALRGLVSDLDTRWQTLEQGCDCRTDEELARLKNSRYGPVNLYISECEYFKRNRRMLNDEEVPVDSSAVKYLQINGMDADLARHFGSLWIRDPLVVFEDRLNLDPTKFADHFENLQSTNWNSVRFKPPPKPLEPVVCDGGMSRCGSRLPRVGWRVELRTPDIQMSDFGNAALAGISCILAMAIYREHWRFYIPMSLLKENFKAAHQRGGLLEGLFYFRNDVDGVSCGSDLDCLCGGKNECSCGDLKQQAENSSDITGCRMHLSSDSGLLPDCGLLLPDLSQSPLESRVKCKKVVCKMSMREIWLGSKRAGFSGLLPMLDKFVSQEWRNQRCSTEAVHKYRVYANYLRSKVLGQLKTDASLIRKLVQSHPTYENNSDVNETITYDICRFGIAAGFGLQHAVDLTPSAPVDSEEGELKHLDAHCCSRYLASEKIFFESSPITKPIPNALSTEIAQSLSNLFSVDSSRLNNQDLPYIQNDSIPDDCGGFTRICRCDSITAAKATSTDPAPAFDTDLFLQVDQLSR